MEEISPNNILAKDNWIYMDVCYYKSGCKCT